MVRRDDVKGCKERDIWKRTDSKSCPKQRRRIRVKPNINSVKYTLVVLQRRHDLAIKLKTRCYKIICRSLISISLLNFQSLTSTVHWLSPSVHKLRKSFAWSTCYFTSTAISHEPKLHTFPSPIHTTFQDSNMAPVSPRNASSRVQHVVMITCRELKYGVRSGERATS
jgi:hypothetical protein